MLLLFVSLRNLFPPLAFLCSTGYLGPSGGAKEFAAAPVSLIATRFHERSIIDRRLW
jgi:hypothetical protein